MKKDEVNDVPNLEFKNAIKEVHPVYYVADLKRSLAFYTNTLGLEKAWEFGTNIAGIKILPNFLIVLCEDKTKVRSSETPALVFAVENIDVHYSELVKRGVSFKSPPEDHAYGRTAAFVDPDGYCYELCG